MSNDGQVIATTQLATAEGNNSLAITAAAYANVTIYQYVSYEGSRPTTRETSEPFVCPYPGLESFHTSESKYFAGREKDVALVEAKLEDYDVCGVIAASGAGKSSLVHAGLISALSKRENEIWDVFAFKPGQEPLYGLARSMSGVLARGDSLDAQLNEIRRNVENLRETTGRLSEYVEDIIRRRTGAISGKHHHVLIFIDQWEELYTRENDRERDILLRELLEVAERGLAKVLLTMRIDFMEEMLRLSTDFFRSLKPGIHYVEPMDETGLRSAIEVPAGEVGLGVPEALTARLIADLGSGRDHGPLPYFQFVLRQLWEKRDEATNSLTTEAYDGMKGLQGAIGTHADAVFRKLTKEEQSLAQRVLPRLANVSEAGAITSRWLPFADFDGPARKLLRKLAEPEKRLIVLSSATEEVAEAEIVAEVAHEALLGDWKTLSGWIADREDFFRLRNKLEADAKTWIENNRRNDFLIPAGKPLLDAQDLLVKALSGDISKDFKDFVDVSVGRARSRKKWITALVTAAASGIAGTAVYLASLNQDLLTSYVALEEQTEAAKSNLNLARTAQKEAQAERDRASSFAEAEAVARQKASALAASEKLAREAADARTYEAIGRQLGAEARLILSELGDVEATSIGAAIAMEAWKRYPTLAAYQALSVAHSKLPVSIIEEGSAAYAVDYSSDGKRLAMAGSIGVAIIVDLNADEFLIVNHSWERQQDLVQDVALSPDNSKIVTGGKDGKVMVFSLPELGQNSDLFPKQALQKIPIGQPVESLEFSQDGKLLAVADSSGEVTIFETSDWSVKASITHSDAVYDVAISPSGMHIATASEDGSVRVSSANDGSELFSRKRGAVERAVAFSPDGDKLAVGGWSSEIQIISLSSREKLLGIPHDKTVNAIAFNNDGTLIAVGSGFIGENTMRVFETISGRDILNVSDSVRFNDVAFHPYEEYLAVASGLYGTFPAGSAAIFDLSDPGATASVDNEESWGLVSSPDGKRLSNRKSSGSVELISVPEMDRRIEIEREAIGEELASTHVAEFSANGELAAVLDSFGWLRVLRTEDLSEVFARRDLGIVDPIAFDRSGKRIAVTLIDGGVAVLDVEDGGSETWRSDPDLNIDAVTSLEYSVSGKSLLAAIYGGIVHVLDAETGDQKTYRETGQSPAIALSETGDRVIFYSPFKKSYLYSTDPFKSISPIGGWEEAIARVRFSPDGKFFATISGKIGRQLVRVHESGGGRMLFSIEREYSKDAPNDLFFTPYSRLLGFGDGPSVRMVSINAGEEVARISINDTIEEFEFINSSNLVAIAGGGKIRLFTTDLDEMSKHICQQRQGTNLGINKWVQFLGDTEEWVPTCSEWRSDSKLLEEWSARQ